jgi:hypothetical protein
MNTDLENQTDVLQEAVASANTKGLRDQRHYKKSHSKTMLRHPRRQQPEIKPTLPFEH